MTAFTDNQGTPLDLKLTWKAMELAKSQGIELGTPTQLYGECWDNKRVLTQVVWCMLAGNGSNLTVEQVFARLQGEAMEAALEAVRQTLVEFFPKDIGAALDAQRAVAEKQRAATLAIFTTEDSSSPELSA